MTNEDALQLIKQAAKEGKWYLTFSVPKDDKSTLINFFRRKNFLCMVPNPDELTVSWRDPVFDAREAHLIASAYAWEAIAKDNLQYFL